MSDLVVGLAKSVVEGALRKVQSAIEEDANLRQRAQRDLVFITLEFEMMQSFLNDANEECIKNNLVATWVRHVRNVAYDVQDCIELVVNLDDRPNWWCRLLPSCMAAPLPLDLAVAEIEQLKARVEDVSKCYTRYNLINDSGSKLLMLQQQASSATALNMIIEAKDATKIMQGLGDLTQLITKEDNNLQVISLWGTGGHLGATSVIRKVYDDSEIFQNFTCRAWVKLMHPFNPREFIRCLMAQFYANSCKEHGAIIGVDVLMKMEATQDDLLKEFVQQVNQKRYLIVLEDVSTIVEWDAIRTFLPDRKNGSLIIVSTQKFEIASLCIGDPYQLLELKQFSAEHSVCAFFKQGSQGDGKGEDNEISTEYKVSHRGGLSFRLRGSSGDLLSYEKILASKIKEARDWMKKDTLVQRESELNELRQYTAKVRFTSSQVSCSMWGIPGVGKSALVRKLYYDRILLEKPQFEKYGWVEVSHPFNLSDFSRSLLLDFYSESLQLKGTAYHVTMGMKDPIEECHNLLSNYRCLVVIDNLQSTQEWDLIKPSLVSRSSQSVIIVITTQASIATHCADNKDEFVFNVKGLEADAAFDLFKREVNRKNASHHMKDHAELQKLILRCGGLPKVIVAIAGSLALSMNKSNIRHINQRFMNELETNPQYDNLRSLFGWMHTYIGNCPDILKPCILYMSIFPREHSIRRRRLLRRWISEGYSKENDYGSLEDYGEKLFSMLVSMSIIQQPSHSVNDTRMVLCRVNSFLYEYIISRRMEENLVYQLGHSRVLTTQCAWHHLTIWEQWIRDKIVFESINFSRLRSLTVFGKWESFFVSKSMKLLRVLDLEDASGVTDNDLKKMVKLLRRLKFLSLRGRHEIRHLPSSLGDLRQLQSLDIRHTSIVSLPANITKLSKLQYFRAGTTVQAEQPLTPCLSISRLSNFCRRRHLVGVKVPTEIGKLTALHTLGVVNVGASESNAILKELKKITQLRKLGVSGINRKNSKKFSSAISGHCHLESLSVQLDKDNPGCLDGILLPMKNLQSLKLYGPVDKLPDLQINQLSKLRKLDLEMTILTHDHIELLGKLPELVILRIRVNPHQDGELNFCVIDNGGGIEVRSYQKVKVLEISCCANLHVTFGSQTMKKLELLKADCCSGSSVQFIGLENLTGLKYALL